MTGRATIKSIARDLGISHMTVSRALSGHANVQKETREKILRHAREIGYVKSIAATAMRGESAPIIGLILPNIVNEFYARFANRLALACEAAAVQLIIHLSGDRIEAEEQALQRLTEVQARAIMMVPAPGGAPSHPRPQPGKTRIVQLIRRRDSGPQGPAILVDDSPPIRRAVGLLHQRGHRRIAYVGTETTLSSGRERLAAFRQGRADVGLKDDDALIRTGAPLWEVAREATRSLIADGRATAILCGGFEISNGVLHALQEANAQTIPMIGYGDPSYYRWLNGGISTIAIPVEKLAEIAATMLLKSDEEDDAVEAIALEAELIMRGSLRDLSGPAGQG